MEIVCLLNSPGDPCMVQDELEVLEGRVKKIIDVVKLLKEERHRLMDQIKDLDEKLLQRKKEFLRLETERRKVRSKVERLLGELSTIK